MSVLKVEAAIECEGCGHHFKVDVDTGGSIPEGWDLMDVIKDSVRGGHIVDSMESCCSVQNDKMLCAVCTGLEDERGEEDK